MADIFFLRHGQAGDPQTWAGPDSDRPLTEDGRSEIDGVAEFLARRAPRPDVIISSPLVRARQTAEIVAARLELSVRIDALLAPGFNATALGRLMRLHAGTPRILVVGHEPDFSTTIEAVIGGGTVTMKKGAIARVRLADGESLTGALLWLAPPGLLLGSRG